jgi:hypothetical protein
MVRRRTIETSSRDVSLLPNYFLEKSADLLTKRMYTHKVLRQLQIMISQTDLSSDLWLILLQVFLAIGDTVLSRPYRSEFLNLHRERYLYCECLVLSHSERRG